MANAEHTAGTIKEANWDESTSGRCLLAGDEHLAQHAHQGAVLQGSCDSFLVSELLVDLLVGAVGALLDADIDAKARGQGLLEADADAEADDGGQGAVGDGGRDLDQDGANRRERRRGRQNVNVGQVDDGEGAQGQRMLRVADGGNEVCHAQGQRGAGESRQGKHAGC